MRLLCCDIEPKVFGERDSTVSVESDSVRKKSKGFGFKGTTVSFDNNKSNINDIPTDSNYIKTSKASPRIRSSPDQTTSMT